MKMERLLIQMPQSIKANLDACRAHSESAGTTLQQPLVGERRGEPWRQTTQSRLRSTVTCISCWQRKRPRGRDLSAQLSYELKLNRRLIVPHLWYTDGRDCAERFQPAERRGFFVSVETRNEAGRFSGATPLEPLD